LASNSQPKLTTDANQDINTPALVWLESEWRKETRAAPPLREFIRQGSLTLLLGQIDTAAADISIPQDRAGLFTGMVRERLRRECQNKENPRFDDTEPLGKRDRMTVLNDRSCGNWLPDDTPFFRALAALAFHIQDASGSSERWGALRWNKAREAMEQALERRRPGDAFLEAGCDLGLFEDDAAQGGEIRFIHQQMQEYFAAWVLADLRARIAAGKALGELGDPRLQAPRLKHGEKVLLPEFAPVAGAEYTIGGDPEGNANEQPARKVMLAGFELALHPVTHAEFACFVQAGGYRDEAYWPGRALEWRQGRIGQDAIQQSVREDRRTILDALGEGASAEAITAETRLGVTTPVGVLCAAAPGSVPGVLRASAVAAASIHTTATSFWVFVCVARPPFDRCSLIGSVATACARSAVDFFLRFSLFAVILIEPVFGTVGPSGKRAACWARRLLEQYPG
jgi:hypothetical protein